MQPHSQEERVAKKGSLLGSKQFLGLKTSQVSTAQLAADNERVTLYILDPRFMAFLPVRPSLSL